MSRPSKYHAQKTMVDGIQFDSKREAKRWSELQLLQKAGEITNLRRQVKFELAPGVEIEGRKRPPIRYIADFVYTSWETLPGGPVRAAETIEDSKGVLTPVFRLKRHLMAAKGFQVRLV